ncbi:unnamed protein product, partial [Bubo scandiacus]
YANNLLETPLLLTSNPPNTFPRFFLKGGKLNNTETISLGTQRDTESAVNSHHINPSQSHENAMVQLTIFAVLITSLTNAITMVYVVETHHKIHSACVTVFPATQMQGVEVQGRT